MIGRILRGVAPVAALAMGAFLAGCDGEVTITRGKGVPLAELDRSGAAPDEIVLAGPDTVVVTDGAELAIAVSGDQAAVESLRFSLEDGALGIARSKEGWKEKGRATIRVTMPAPRTLTLAGSGTIEAATLARSAEVVIAGSGTARVTEAALDRLELTLAGSGNFAIAGRAEALELTLAGSGTAPMEGLSVDTAEVTIAGSGSAAFASDGTVEASIMGSGDVTVLGRATCTVNAMGSGTLRCAEASARTGAAPAAPTAPPTAPGRPAPPAPPAEPTPPTPPPPPAAPETPE